jgi:hypothetical protein
MKPDDTMTTEREVFQSILAEHRAMFSNPDTTLPQIGRWYVDWRYRMEQALEAMEKSLAVA